MAAFIIADTKIENPEEYEDYKKNAKRIAESPPAGDAARMTAIVVILATSC